MLILPAYDISHVIPVFKKSKYVMTALFSSIHKASYELTPAHLRLSPAVWTAIASLNKIHGAWRWYRRFEVYRNPDNLAQLIAGHATQLVLGDTLIVRIAAQCLLVATRLLDCAQQQAALYRSGQRLIATIKGHYQPSYRLSWEHSQGYCILSPSSVYWWKTMALTLWERTTRIVLCSLNLFKHVFKLSMRMMDVVDAFCWSPAVQEDSINEGFVNVSKWLKAVVEKKEDLLAGVTENREIIERFMEYSPFTYDQLHSGLVKALDKTEVAYQGVKTLSDLGGDAAISLGKRALSGGMVVVGMADYRPTTLA